MSAIDRFIEWRCGCGDSIPTDMQMHIVFMEAVVGDAINRRNACPCPYEVAKCASCPEQPRCENIELLTHYRKVGGLR